MSRRRLALVLAATAVALGVPEPAGAELRFRDCKEGHCALIRVPLDHRGAVPGRLELAVRRAGPGCGGDVASSGPLRIDGPGGLDGVFRLRDTDEDLVLRLRGRIAGRRVRVRVHVPSRLVAKVEEEGGFARAAALPWRLR